MRLLNRQAPPATPSGPSPLLVMLARWGFKLMAAIAVLVVALIALAAVPQLLVGNPLLIVIALFAGSYLLARRTFRQLTVKVHLDELVNSLRDIRRPALTAASAASAIALISSLASHAGLFSVVQSTASAGLLVLLVIALWRNR